MTKKTEPELIWAVDRDTNEPGQYTEAFLQAWPRKFTRLAEAPKSRPRASAAASVPEGTDKERSE